MIWLHELNIRVTIKIKRLKQCHIGDKLHAVQR
jgi:hypothetical protein